MITTFLNQKRFREKYSHQGDYMDHTKVGKHIVTILTIYQSTLRVSQKKDIFLSV